MLGILSGSKVSDFGLPAAGYLQVKRLFFPE
jgi:hypothetical protein